MTGNFCLYSDPMSLTLSMRFTAQTQWSGHMLVQQMSINPGIKSIFRGNWNSIRRKPMVRGFPGKSWQIKVSLLLCKLACTLFVDVFVEIQSCLSLLGTDRRHPAIHADSPYRCKFLLGKSNVCFIFSFSCAHSSWRQSLSCLWQRSIFE